MPICLITINSKNKQSLFNFLSFLVYNVKIDSIIKCIKTKKNKKVITVLKSPHVNKKAQEQFEIRNLNNKFLLFSHNTPKCFIVLKAIKAKLFPDIKIKINFFIKSNNSLKFKSKIFNPNNYTLGICTPNTIGQKLSSNKIINLNLIKKTNNYLKILDSYGELNLQFKFG